MLTTSPRPTFVCLFFYQPARNKTKQRATKRKRKNKTKKEYRVWIERRRREKKQQHDENNEAKCVDDDWALFFTFPVRAPLSLLRAPCVCGRGERESNNNNSKVHWPCTRRACCLCVCVSCCCLLWMANGARTNAPMCRDRWTRFLKGLLMLTLGAQSYTALLL